MLIYLLDVVSLQVNTAIAWHRIEYLAPLNHLQVTFSIKLRA